jgi:hypothetical protein
MGKHQRKLCRKLGQPHQNRIRPHPSIKGQAHHNYRSINKKVAIGVMNEIIDTDFRFVRHGFVVGLSMEWGVPESTIRTWMQHVTIDPNWRPWKTNWGQGSRVFSDDEEQELVLFVKNNFISKKRLFGDSDFRILACSEFAKKIQQFEGEWNGFDFICSAGFITDFKRRNHISSRTFHYKRRDNFTQEQAQWWIHKMTNLLNTVSHDCIVNVDETSWLLWPRGLLTWSETGADSVQVEANGDEKAAITVTAAITASNQKLPLQIIAKGKTGRVHFTQLGDVGNNWVDHSQSGWQTEVTFGTYLRCLRNHYGDRSLHLILDLYPTHRTETIRSLASDLDIQLYFIPAGATDRLQPLDRSVFAVLKASAKRLFHERCMCNIGDARKKKDAVADLLKAWELLGTSVIEEGWSIYEDVWEDALDDA